MAAGWGDTRGILAGGPLFSYLASESLTSSARRTDLRLATPPGPLPTERIEEGRGALRAEDALTAGLNCALELEGGPRRLGVVAEGLRVEAVAGATSRLPLTLLEVLLFLIVFFLLGGCSGTPRALPAGEEGDIGVALAEGFFALGKGMFMTLDD